MAYTSANSVANLQPIPTPPLYSPTAYLAIKWSSEKWFHVPVLTCSFLVSVSTKSNRLIYYWLVFITFFNQYFDFPKWVLPTKIGFLFGKWETAMNQSNTNMHLQLQFKWANGAQKKKKELIHLPSVYFLSLINWKYNKGKKRKLNHL